MKRFQVGYTQGTFDTFHTGHLNIIRNAKAQCERLIVGVNSDSLVLEYKHKQPILNERERLELMRELRSVDEVILCQSLDKTATWQQLHFDAIFIGDDWKGNERWAQTERDLAPLGAVVIYLPHTDGISTTMVREIIKK